jgi:hypothetical protein
MLDRFRFGVCFGVGLCGVAAAHNAAAAPQDYTGVTHFSLEGSVLGYQRLKLSPTQAGNSSDVVDPNGPALPPPATSSSTTLGLLGSGFGVGFDYGILDNLLVGAQLQLTSTKENQAGSDTTGTQVQFLPHLEYLFDGTDVRPYVAAILGAGYDSTKIPVAGFEPATVSGTEFLFGASFGLHAFLSDRLSVDPAVTFLGASGSQTSTTPVISVDGTSSSDVSRHDSVGGYQILLSVGLSAWLGGAPARAPLVPPNAEPAASAPAAPEKTPLAGFIGFSDHRELRLQLPGDPNLPSVIVDVLVRDDDRALSNCQKIQVMDGATPLTLYLTGRGDKPHNKHVRHFISGVLPVHALTVLARPGSALTVCDDSWPLTPEARHLLHVFLARRLQLTTPPNEPLEPEPPADAPNAPVAPLAPPAPETATPNSATPPPNVPAPAPAPAPATPAPSRAPTQAK